MTEQERKQKHLRVTSVIGPKVKPTEMTLEANLSIADYRKLEQVADQLNKDVDDLLRDAIREFIEVHRHRRFFRVEATSDRPTFGPSALTTAAISH